MGAVSSAAAISWVGITRLARPIRTVMISVGGDESLAEDGENQMLYSRHDGSACGKWSSGLPSRQGGAVRDIISALYPFPSIGLVQNTQQTENSSTQ